MKYMPLLLLFICGCLPQKVEPEERHLYILHATRGHFTSDPINPQTEGKLTFFDTDNTVIVFTQSPKHRTDTQTLSHLLNDWEEGTGFIFFENSEKKFSELSMEISDPTIDPINQTVNFHVHTLEGEFSFDRKEMKDITLFLDASEAKK